MTQKPGLVLRCGCEIPFREGKDAICPQHGDQRVVRALRMPKPRFSIDLTPHAGRIVGSEAKES